MWKKGETLSMGGLSGYNMESLTFLDFEKKE
jgi:hypothetical protein